MSTEIETQDLSKVKNDFNKMLGDFQHLLECRINIMDQEKELRRVKNEVNLLIGEFNDMIIDFKQLVRLFNEYSLNDIEEQNEDES